MTLQSSVCSFVRSFGTFLLLWDLNPPYATVDDDNNNHNNSRNGKKRKRGPVILLVSLDTPIVVAGHFVLLFFLCFIEVRVVGELFSLSLALQL